MIYLGIDWSGAQSYQGDPVQLALTSDEETRAEVVAPPDGQRRWTRTTVFHAMHGFYQELLRTGERAVVGLDFSFAFPFVDAGAYFPGDDVALADAAALRARIEEECRHSSDFFCGTFYWCQPYNQYFLVYPNLKGDRYQPRLRVTEKMCADEYGITPQSNFHLVGPRTVGIGSCAGMRWLQAMTESRRRGETDFRLWPFEPVRPDDRLVFVEIYPRLCRLLLDNPTVPREMPVHQRDALFAALGVKHICQRPDCWDVSTIPADTISTEGWIFGV